MKPKIKQTLRSAIALLLILTACQEKELSDPPRLFRPVVEGSTGGTWIHLTWQRYTGTESYIVEISDNPDLANILETITTEEPEWRFEGLWYNTQYYLRIQGIGNNVTSAPATYSAKTTKYPTQLLAPAASDCIDTQVRVKWNTETYDSLKVYIGKEFIKTILLTAENNDSKTVIIRDLTPATTYTIQAYRQDEYQGEMDYATVASQILEGDYIDLRALEPAEAYTQLTQENFDTWSAQYPNGFTLVLDGGIRYEFAVVNLAGSVKITTGLSLAGNAILEDNGSFALNDGVTAEYLTLENLIITEHTNSLRSAGNFGGRYLFNFNKAGGTVAQLNLVNCDIRYKRGVIRAQAATQIDQIRIENCLIDSIGGYGITNADHAEAWFKNVVIKNSTVAHAEKIVVASKPTPTDVIQSITIENLTLCYAPKGEGNYIIDYNNQTLPGGITIKNSIFGAGWGSKIRGQRSSAGNIVVDNCFRAADLEWTLNASTGEPQNPINDLQPVSETTDNLFADPQNVNFKITHPALVDQAGDSRWWK